MRRLTRRRASLAAGLMAGTAAGPLGLALSGALALAGAGAAAAQDAPAPSQTLTARISERFTADSNYRLDDPSPGTSYYADTRLVLGFEKNTATQTFGLGLDTGLRAIYPLPRGQLTGRIFQNYTGTDTGGQEAQVSGVSVGLRHEINEVSSFALNFGYAIQVDVDDTTGQPSDPDIHRTNVTAIYSHDLTGTVSADIGYRYRHREEDPQSADSHAVFVEIGKAFTTLP